MSPLLRHSLTSFVEDYVARKPYKNYGKAMGVSKCRVPLTFSRFIMPSSFGIFKLIDITT